MDPAKSEYQSRQDIYDILRKQLRVLSESGSLRMLSLTGVYIHRVHFLGDRSGRFSSHLNRRELVKMSVQFHLVPILSVPNSRQSTVCYHLCLLRTYFASGRAIIFSIIQRDRGLRRTFLKGFFILSPLQTIPFVGLKSSLHRCHVSSD